MSTSYDILPQWATTIMVTMATTQYVEQFEHVCKHAELTWSVHQDYERMTGIKMQISERPQVI